MTPVYVVEIGPDLYLSALHGIFGRNVTKNITNAYWYTDEYTAQRDAKRAKGQVQKYVLERMEERDSEIDMLRSAVIQLQKERDEALRKLQK